jgi:hypothetical protein
MDRLIVYPDGVAQPGVEFETANGFVQRVVSAVANSGQMGCLPDAEETAEILNAYFAARAALSPSSES